MDLSSNEILHRIISGDEIAFKNIYQFYYPRLYYFAKQYLFDAEASKDIVQEVFAELWDKRRTFKDGTNLQAWLYTVTKNKSLHVISHLKSRQNYQDYLLSRQLDINYDSLSELDTSQFIFEELQEQIQIALDKLPPACRKVFIMSRFEDKKNKEIAEELNINIKTVEGHISKALKSLKIDLKNYLPLIQILFLFHQ